MRAAAHSHNNNEATASMVDDSPQPAAAAMHSGAPVDSAPAAASASPLLSAAASSPEHSVIMHRRDVYERGDRADEEEKQIEEAQEIELQTVRIHTIPASSSATAASASSLSAPPSFSPAASPSSAAAPPSAAQWQSELRSQWESGALRAASEKARPKPLPYRPPLSPAVLARPPLNGDVVWNRTPPKPVSRLACEDFLRASKLASLRFHRMTRQIISMSIPVCILCAVILLYEELVVRHERNTHVARHMLVYKERSEDSTAHKFRGSLLNGLTVLGAIVAITAVFIVLYVLEWRRALRLFLTSVICALMLPWIYFSYQFLSYYSIPVDALSYTLFLVNFLAVGVVGLISMAETTSNLNRAYLLVVAMSVAWPFMEFSEWSVWTTIVVLTIYDLIAVLAPCGPLRYIMKQEVLAKSSATREPPMPGMMYRGEFFMLGLGDLVFYGALMGRAANAGFVVLACTCLGVLTGLSGTILWSYHTVAHAIPALPLSVFFGLLFYACAALTIRSLVEQSASMGWQIPAVASRLPFPSLSASMSGRRRTSQTARLRPDSEYERKKRKVDLPASRMRTDEDEESEAQDDDAAAEDEEPSEQEEDDEQAAKSEEASSSSSHRPMRLATRPPRPMTVSKVHFVHLLSAPLEPVDDAAELDRCPVRSESDPLVAFESTANNLVLINRAIRYESGIATAANLARGLTDGCRVLHLQLHSSASLAAAPSGLVFETNEGTAHPIAVAALKTLVKTLIRRYAPYIVVVVRAVHSVEAAQSLLAAGFEHVVAMDLNVPDQACVEFERDFYSELLHDGSVTASFRRAHAVLGLGQFSQHAARFRLLPDDDAKHDREWLFRMSPLAEGPMVRVNALAETPAKIAAKLPSTLIDRADVLVPLFAQLAARRLVWLSGPGSSTVACLAARFASLHRWYAAVTYYCHSFLPGDQYSSAELQRVLTSFSHRVRTSNDKVLLVFDNMHHPSARAWMEHGGEAMIGQLWQHNSAQFLFAGQLPHAGQLGCAPVSLFPAVTRFVLPEWSPLRRAWLFWHSLAPSHCLPPVAPGVSLLAHVTELTQLPLLRMEVTLADIVEHARHLAVHSMQQRLQVQTQREAQRQATARIEKDQQISVALDLTHRGAMISPTSMPVIDAM